MPNTISIGDNDIFNKGVYIIQEQGTNFVKIGYSETPNKRVTELQTGNPRKLILIAIRIGATEKREHERFNTYRILGEWFLLTPGLAMSIFTDYSILKWTPELSKNLLSHKVYYNYDGPESETV